ncbi:MAG TPA: BLUF domain-containing protein [Brevundimonas sp.]
MARPLERVAYVSTATLSLESLLVITDILAVSQRNNARDHLTGALEFSEGKFFQVIEGQTADVDRLMNRVMADRRHTDIEIVTRLHVEGRLFPDWSMTAPRIAPEMEPAIRKAVAESRSSPTAAIEMMRRIAMEDGIHSG